MQANVLGQLYVWGLTHPTLFVYALAFVMAVWTFVAGLAMVRKAVFVTFRIFRKTDYGYDQVSRPVTDFLTISWPFLGLMPRFRYENREIEAIIAWQPSRDVLPQWWSDQVYGVTNGFVLARKPWRVWDRWSGAMQGTLTLQILICVLLGLYGGLLYLGDRQAAQAAATAESTQITITAEPEETVEPQATALAAPVELGPYGGALVIDLGREAPPSEVWEWLMNHVPATSGPAPDLPWGWTPPEWLVQLFGQPVTVIRIGVSGYVFVAQTELGLEFIRTDELFKQIGSSEFVLGNSATVTAGDYHWGVSYDTRKSRWNRLTGGYKGNVELVVFEDVYEPAFVLRGKSDPWVWYVIAIAIGGFVGAVLGMWRRR